LLGIKDQKEIKKQMQTKYQLEITVLLVLEDLRWGSKMHFNFHSKPTLNLNINAFSPPSRTRNGKKKKAKVNDDSTILKTKFVHHFQIPNL